MSSVCRSQDSGRDLKDTDPNRHKHVLTVILDNGIGEGGSIQATATFDENMPELEDWTDEKKIEVKEIYHKINNKNKEDIIKYRLGLEIKVYVEKHIFKHDEESSEVLPKEFYTDVTYDNKIKALSIELGTYNVVALDRMSDFFNVISDGILEISNGTLVNFATEFKFYKLNSII